MHMAHKFRVGQAVDYHPPRGIDAPHRSYLIAALLPERDGEFHYHIRHPSEVHVRIVSKSQMNLAREATAPRGWRVMIYPPGNQPVLAEYASSLEKGSKDQVIKEAKQIVDTDLERRLRISQR